MIMVSSSSFSRIPLKEVFSTVSERFDGWEISAEGTLYLPDIEKELAELLKSQPLEIQVHAPLSDINIAGANPYMRESALNEIKKAISASGNLGVKVMTLHPGFRTPLYKRPEKVREETKKSLKILERHALDSGITLALENMPDTFITVGKAPWELEEMTEGLEVKWCFDVGHANTTGTMDDFLKHKERFANIHLHDNNGKMDEHLPLGDGDIEWKKVFRGLKGYGGNLVLEMDRGMGDALKSLESLKEVGFRDMIS